jgi:hypothetical protein
MSCCGRSRAGPPGAGAPTNQAGAVQPVPYRKTLSGAPASAVTLEYQANRVLTVTGPVTGATYRFVGQGARSSVDVRDRASLLAVPGLRQVPT